VSVRRGRTRGERIGVPVENRWDIRSDVDIVSASQRVQTDDGSDGDARDGMQWDGIMRWGVLMNTDLWKIHDLEKVGVDLDFLAQLAVVSAFLKSADLEGSEFVERDGRHGDVV
jgi:hypothetical protein